MAEKKEEKQNRATTLLGQAAGNTANLVIAGSAAVGAAALQSWPVLAIGGTAYAAMVAWDFFNPKKSQNKKRKELPALSALHDPGAKQITVGIQAAQQEMKQVLSETPKQVKSHLGLILHSVEELQEHAVGLIFRLEDLSKYLVSKNPNAIRTAIDHLQGRENSTNDSATKGEYQRAKNAKQEQLRALQDIENAKDRTLATLSRIQATLEGLPAKVVRMRAMDAQAMDALTGDVSQELDQMNGEIQSFEETLESLAEVPNL